MKSSTTMSVIFPKQKWLGLFIMPQFVEFILNPAVVTSKNWKLSVWPLITTLFKHNSYKSIINQNSSNPGCGETGSQGANCDCIWEKDRADYVTSWRFLLLSKGFIQGLLTFLSLIGSRMTVCTIMPALKRLLYNRKKVWIPLNQFLTGMILPHRDRNNAQRVLKCGKN